MPKVKQQATLSGLVDSDSEDDQFGIPTPDSAAENKMPAKKVRGRPKAAPTKPAPTKVTKTKAKAPARRTSGRLVAKAMEMEVDAMPAPARTKTKRPALKDRTNQYAGDEDELDEFDRNVVMDGTVEDSMVAAKKTKSKVAKMAVVARGKSGKAPKQNDSIQEAPEAAKPKARATKKTGPAKKEKPAEPSPEKIVQETQYEEMDVDTDADMDEVVEEPISKPARSISRTHSHSRQRQPSVQRRRAGSASDTERNDPVLRRKLGEITKKYEVLNIKYQDLRQIGVKEAERNMDKLRKEGESTNKSKLGKSIDVDIADIILDAGEYIKSLRADLAVQTAAAKKADGLKKKLESQAAEVTTLKEQIAKLTANLSEAQSETKTLSAKLAANRTASASVESAHSKTPGSAMKANGGIRLMGTAEAAQVAQAAQLKEDLYSDLTGLIMRSVKREPEEDIFDCIQTGRNGSKYLSWSPVAITDRSTSITF